MSKIFTVFVIPLLIIHLISVPPLALASDPGSELLTTQPAHGKVLTKVRTRGGSGVIKTIPAHVLAPVPKMKIKQKPTTPKPTVGETEQQETAIKLPAMMRFERKPVTLSDSLKEFGSRMKPRIKVRNRNQNPNQNPRKTITTVVERNQRENQMMKVPLISVTNQQKNMQNQETGLDAKLPLPLPMMQMKFPVLPPRHSTSAIIAQAQAQSLPRQRQRDYLNQIQNEIKPAIPVVRNRAFQNLHLTNLKPKIQFQPTIMENPEPPSTSFVYHYNKNFSPNSADEPMEIENQNYIGSVNSKIDNIKRSPKENILNTPKYGFNTQSISLPPPRSSLALEMAPEIIYHTSDDEYYRNFNYNENPIQLPPKHYYLEPEQINNFKPFQYQNLPLIPQFKKIPLQASNNPNPTKLFDYNITKEFVLDPNIAFVTAILSKFAFFAVIIYSLLHPNLVHLPHNDDHEIDIKNEVHSHGLRYSYGHDDDRYENDSRENENDFEPEVDRHKFGQQRIRHGDGNGNGNSNGTTVESEETREEEDGSTEKVFNEIALAMPVKVPLKGKGRRRPPLKLAYWKQNGGGGQNINGNGHRNVINGMNHRLPIQVLRRRPHLRSRSSAPAPAHGQNPRQQLFKFDRVVSNGHGIRRKKISAELN